MFYNVIQKVYVFKYIGKYEADSEDDAIIIAEKDVNANWDKEFCHDCSKIFGTNFDCVIETFAEEDE
jgi:hypothetical protein